MRLSLWLPTAALTFIASAAAQACTFTVLPAGLFLDASAQTSTVTVTASAQTCDWSASAAGSVTIVSGATGKGNGSVSISVPANTSAADTAVSLTIAGQPVVVTQRFTTTPFGDVQPSDFFFDSVDLLRVRAITAGCSAIPLLFCPNDNITRDQMAVFIIRSIFGGDNFTYSSTPSFTDVPADYRYFKWIQKMKELGITAGCGATTYCPGDQVTRGQMAVFIVRARYGALTTFSYSSTPYFSDVLAGNSFFSWIQKMKQIGITAGCSATTYCPDDSVTRGQMAIFVMRGEFNQLLPDATPLITISGTGSAPGATSVTVTIAGSNTNFVQGTTQVKAGAGITITNVAVASLTSLTASFAVDPAASIGPRSVIATTGGEEAVLPNGFVVTAAQATGPPTITSFSPASAAAGALISVIGSNFVPGLAAAPTVTLNQQGGGTIAAPLLSANPSNLTFVVPANAATGPIAVAVGSQNAASATPLTITAGAVFTLSANPAVVNLIQGQSAALALQMSSNDAGFNALANLSLTGLPAGITATFNPPAITAGQTAVATLTASVSQPITTSSLTVTATSVANSAPLSQSATAQLAIKAPTTSLIGRTVVSDATETPLAGVTITMLGKDGNGGVTNCVGSGVSDSGGNFALVNLPASCVGPQLTSYDGTTATAPLGKYAGVNLVYTLVSGQVTASPVLVHLPRIDNQETFSVKQNFATDQSYSYLTIPGLFVTVYAHTTFTMPDGSKPDPFPLTAVHVPVDRLPDLKPPVPTMLNVFIVAFQPANATTNQPVAVYYPNVLNVAPGADMPLLTLDPTHGKMIPYGTGFVSDDGTQIVPDMDPSSPGHRFGIVHFDWHGAMPAPPIQNNPAPPGSGTGGGPCTPGGSPGGGTGPGSCPSPTPTPTPTPTTQNPCNSCPCSAGLRPLTTEPPWLETKPERPVVAANYDPQRLTEEPGVQAGDPVDVNTGILVITNTDLAFSGSRGSVGLVRNYRSMTAVGGPFGTGTNHNFNYGLDTFISLNAGVINLIMPDGNRFPFSPRFCPGGGTCGKINTGIPSLAGAVMGVNGDNTVDLRWKNGTVYHFVPIGFALGSLLGSITDPNGNTITVARDSGGKVSTITDPVGRSLTFTYDGSGHVTSITDPIGQMALYTYNPQGSLASFTDPDGGVTSYAYDPANNMLQMTDARGIVQMQNTLDAAGRVIKQVRPDGGSLTFSYTVLNPDAVVSPILHSHVKDSLGVEADYRFNVNGYLTDVTSTQGQTRHIERADSSNLVSFIAEAKHVTTYTYDGLGNILTSTDPTGLTTTFTYELVFNKITTIADPLGNVTRFTYDVKGNLLTTTDANGNITTFQYDATGLVTKVTDALGQSTTYVHDGSGNLISVTSPLGNTTQFAYDGLSRLTQTIDALGRRTAATYDGLGRLLTRTDAKGAVTTSTYDADGNLNAIKDARGNTNTFAYDPMNRLVSRTDGLGKSDSRTWDTNGNLVKYVDRRGQTSTYTFDILNRLTTETYSDATVSRSYDWYGRLSQVNDSAGGVFTFDRDFAGRLLGTTTPYGAVNYTYDGRGAMVSRQVASQAALTYSYDPVGNLASAAIPQAAATFAYTARNQLSGISRGNGVSSAYNFDSDGRLLGITHVKGAAILASDSYGYDAVGNRLSHTTGIGQPFVTPATNNTYNAANQLTQFGSTANIFDLNGNLSQEGSTASYVWDGRNRLKSIVTSAGQTTAFTYDFRGNLLLQADRGPSLNVSKSFILDDLTNIAFQSASDGTSYSVLAGRSIDSHLGVSQVKGQTLFGLTDGMNSTIATVDEGGAKIAEFSYEPYGEATTSGVYPFQFAGRTPVNTYIYYNRARFYASEKGRFISEDPLARGVVTPGANFYRYAQNEPSRYRDARGLFPLSDVVDAVSTFVDAFLIVPFAKVLNGYSRSNDNAVNAAFNEDVDQLTQATIQTNNLGQLLQTEGQLTGMLIGANVDPTKEGILETSIDVGADGVQSCRARR